MKMNVHTSACLTGPETHEGANQHGTVATFPPRRVQGFPLRVGEGSDQRSIVNDDSGLARSIVAFEHRLIRFFHTRARSFRNGERVAARLSFGMALCLVAVAPAHADKIRDLVQVAGVRSNQLIGYGLVVGLDGSGDQTTQA
ncbi:MAG: flagellar basal body P-ring protein FlgI, partial [Rhodanobacter sp.]